MIAIYVSIPFIVILVRSVSIPFSVILVRSVSIPFSVILVRSVSIPFIVILVRSVSEDTRIQYIDVIVYGSSGRVPTGLAQG